MKKTVEDSPGGLVPMDTGTDEGEEKEEEEEDKNNRKLSWRFSPLKPRDNEKDQTRKDNAKKRLDFGDSALPSLTEFKRAIQRHKKHEEERRQQQQQRVPPRPLPADVPPPRQRQGDPLLKAMPDAATARRPFSMTVSTVGDAHVHFVGIPVLVLLLPSVENYEDAKGMMAFETMGLFPRYANGLDRDQMPPTLRFNLMTLDRDKKPYAVEFKPPVRHGHPNFVHGIDDVPNQIVPVQKRRDPAKGQDEWAAIFAKTGKNDRQPPFPDEFALFEIHAQRGPAGTLIWNIMPTTGTTSGYNYFGYASTINRIGVILCVEDAETRRYEFTRPLEQE